MPAYLRGKVRDNLVFVKVTIGNVFYGFKTKDLTSIEGVSQADLTALGHTKLQNLRSGSIPILGANAPKPPRVKKQVVRNPSRNQQGSVSTFCGMDNIDTGITAGWEIVSLRTPYRLTSNARTVTVAANFHNGGLYLFNMNRADAEAYGLELGLAFDNDLITGYYLKRFAFTGASRPKPPVVSKKVGRGTFSCYCSPVGLKQAIEEHGYNLVKAEVSLDNPNAWIDEFGYII